MLKNLKGQFYYEFCIMKKLLGIVVVGFYRILDTELDLFGIKPGLE